MSATRGKFGFQILAAGLLGLGLTVAGVATQAGAQSNPGMAKNGQPVVAHQAGKKDFGGFVSSFEFGGSGTLTSSVFDAACEGQTCTTSQGANAICGCLTYSGTGNGTKIGPVSWTFNQTTNDDDVVLTGLNGDRCYPTEGDGVLTAWNGDTLNFSASGWGCEYGGQALFNINNTITLGSGTGRFANAAGTANMAGSVDFSTSNTVLSIDGVLQGVSLFDGRKHKGR
ncbi:MAG TPA: hypothetical protein VMV15_06175 [Candidatus Binataceae bacterium]|nr:hypothetical protein [Candidatus Binataceae bacterium]